MLDNDICTADGGTMGDDDPPAVPGINTDNAYPSSASTSPALHTPTIDDRDPGTKPSATAPPGCNGR